MKTVSVVVLLVLLQAGGRAAAQDQKAVAAQLFEAAGELMAAGKLAEACPKYAESQRLDPQLGTLLHLGECLDAQGKTASAWANFKDALELAAARGDLREPKIRARLNAIEPKVPRLTIRVAESAPADLEIKRNGSVVGRPAWGLALPIDPGEHTISAAAAGRVPWSQSVRLAVGARATLDVPELVIAAVSGVPSPEPTVAEVSAPQPTAASVSNVAPAFSSTTDQGPADKRGNGQRIAGWGALALGAIGVGVGLVFDIRSFAKVGERDDVCPAKVNCAPGSQATINVLQDQARSARRIGTIGLIAGGLLAAGGLALIFTAPSDSKEARVVSLAPVLATDHQGVILMGQL